VQYFDRQRDTLAAGDAQCDKATCKAITAHRALATQVICPVKTSRNLELASAIARKLFQRHLPVEGCSALLTGKPYSAAGIKTMTAPQQDASPIRENELGAAMQFLASALHAARDTKNGPWRPMALTAHPCPIPRHGDSAALANSAEPRAFRARVRN
jgi:hypothetical protein